MEFIHVKEEIIDKNEFETHPVTNTGDWGGYTCWWKCEEGN